MLVSVVVPAYNAATTILETLRSVLAQTYRAIEVIVVDDGSTDETAALVAAVAAADTRVVLLTQSNSGPAAARNRAIAEARGAFLAPIDADDLWHPEFLARLIAAMARPEIGFAYCPHRIIDDAGRVLRDFPVLGCEGRVLQRLTLVNFVGTGSAAVYRRTAVVEAGGFDVRSFAWGGGEDYLLQLAVAAQHRVALVPDYLVGYRRRPGSLSSDPFKAMESRLRVVEDALARYPRVPHRVLAWNRSDARRVAAVGLLSQRRPGAALALFAGAVADDPAAAFWDGACRLRNALARALGRGGRSVANRPPFAALAPDATRAPGPDPLTRRRLAALGRADEADEADRPPSA
jgi:glycosyltransferase involved in cell wall biosynthesis